MSWVLRRVDDRLIHGQVVVAWGNHLRPRRIWVVDDAAASSAWERDLLASVGPPEVQVRVLTVAEAAADYAAEENAQGAAILLMRDLKTAVGLLEAGVALHTVNLGGIHYAQGRTKINEYLYMNDADRERARRLIAAGVILEVQDVPATRPLPLAAIDPEMARS
ncbi:MAG TPA: PTS sugar transporter subunit IIB [Candidatus Eisenbacteria bacterium]|nr:PTS sugar transporter subunit IIB [Candidatus Eisenbacteria bacterium]